MSKDIVECGMLSGKASVEVGTLPGAGFSECGETCIVYCPGFLPGFPAAPEILAIFPENGRVVKVRQRAT